MGRFVKSVQHFGIQIALRGLVMKSRVGGLGKVRKMLNCGGLGGDFVGCGGQRSGNGHSGSFSRDID